jgi:hypothetical protein
MVEGAMQFQQTPCTYDENAKEMKCIEPSTFYISKEANGTATAQDRVCVSVSKEREGEEEERQRIARELAIQKEIERKARVEREQAAMRAAARDRKAESERLSRRQDMMKLTEGTTAKFVEYVVTGSAKRAMVTFINATGGTEQHVVNIPWRKDFMGSARDIVTLSAQKQSVNGIIEVKIISNGQVIGSSSSSAAYGIASTPGVILR